MVRGSFRGAFALLAAVGCALFAFTPSAFAYVAPDPGGSETASVPLPPSGKYLGLNDDMAGGFHGLATVDYLELTRTIGGNAPRTIVDWRSAEPTEGSWSAGAWSTWQAFYDGALVRGMTPILTIAYAPTWAREPGLEACTAYGACEFPPGRAYDDDWARFAAEVARRFPKAIIEIWNEANLKFSWESGPDPQRFAELLRIAYNAIKAVSPSTYVLAGGLGNVQVTRDGHIALREFLDRAYRATPSIKGRMDALSFHPYPWGLTLGADTLFAKSFDDVRSVKGAYGDAATPLFVSEVAISTASGYTEAEQADALLRLYRRTMTMGDVRGVVFHRAIEPRDTSSNPMEWGYAWTRYGANPAAPRPVYCRFVAEADRSYPGCPGELPLTVELKSTPPSTTSARTVSFAFESPNYGVTYQCSLDGAAYAACWSPKSYSVAPGVHRFAVRARYRDGTLGAPATYRFKVRR